MRNFLLTFGFSLTFALGNSATAAPAPLQKLQEVAFTQVQITDSFWRPRQETNRLASIPVNLAMLEKSGNVRNFELAAAGQTNGFSGPVFMDSDIYKALEAASYSLATHPDPDLEQQLDTLIAKIAAAQQPDGYLNTHFIVKAPGQRWTNLRDWHELYCAGHLFEGAVAHYQATGKKTFLQVATRLADHIDSVFGPGKRMGYPGHPEIELALIKLWHVTGEKRYFELARFFIENRGRRYFAEEHHENPEHYDGTYWQDDVPIVEHRSIKGHAVRAAYLLSGATDVAAETENPALLRMIQRVWRNTTEKNMYLTGGIGPSAHNEGFTADYDLPNLTAYQETCASVALAQWNHRLALLYGDARYVDVVERSLYNGVLAGVSLDGTRFFYVNPLESQGTHHRSSWFGCACCPPNAARTIASLGGYAYATSEQALWVNLYVQGSVDVKLRNRKVSVQVTTDYPWDGKITLKPSPETETEFELRLRIPGWSHGATVTLNGEPVPNLAIDRGYARIARTWRRGDSVELNLPMPVERVLANPNVQADRGLVALQRGPLVYCLEACDQTGSLSQLYLPAGAGLTASFDRNVLGGLVVVRGAAETADQATWNRTLYQRAPSTAPVAFTAVPYFAWDNRAAGLMKVWVPVAPAPSKAGGLETEAQLSLSYVSGNCQPFGINDGVEPKSSGEQPEALCHWWPHKGGSEWAQYTWPSPVRVQGAKVYWFDDTGRGECRLPKDWEIQYLDDGTWKSVPHPSAFATSKDQWCETTFDPILTKALRLKIELQPRWAAGVHEWKVIEAED